MNLMRSTALVLLLVSCGSDQRSKPKPPRMVPVTSVYTGKRSPLGVADANPTEGPSGKASPDSTSSCIIDSSESVIVLRFIGGRVGANGHPADTDVYSLTKKTTDLVRLMVVEHSLTLKTESPLPHNPGNESTCNDWLREYYSADGGLGDGYCAAKLGQLYGADWVILGRVRAARTYNIEVQLIPVSTRTDHRSKAFLVDSETDLPSKVKAAWRELIRK